MRLCALLFVIAAPAGACEDIHAAITGSEAELQALGPSEETPICRAGLALGGGRFNSCGWPFPLRDDAAVDAARAVAAEIEACGGLAEDAGSDTGVNHPDSYVSRRFLVGEGALTVAVKDKVPLGQTLVWLTAERPG